MSIPKYTRNIHRLPKGKTKRKEGLQKTISALTENSTN